MPSTETRKSTTLEFQNREQVQQNYQKQARTTLTATSFRQVLQKMIRNPPEESEYPPGLTFTDKRAQNTRRDSHPYGAPDDAANGIGDRRFLRACKSAKQGLHGSSRSHSPQAWAPSRKRPRRSHASKFQNCSWLATPTKLDAIRMPKHRTGNRTGRQGCSNTRRQRLRATDADSRRIQRPERPLRLQEPTKRFHTYRSTSTLRADLAEARKVVNGAIASLRTQNGTEGLIRQHLFVINRVNAPLCNGTQLRNPSHTGRHVTEVSFSTTPTPGQTHGSTSQVDSVLVEMAMVTDAPHRLRDGSAQLRLKPTPSDDKVRPGFNLDSLVDPRWHSLKDELATPRPAHTSHQGRTKKGCSCASDPQGARHRLRHPQSNLRCRAFGSYRGETHNTCALPLDQHPPRIHRQGC